MANELQTRTTVMAIVEESTQNTVVAPSATTQFIPVQSGFTVTPSFEAIENTELQSSIGTPKPTKGYENPTASVSLYMKHSGVEGTAPNWSLLLKALFGSQVTASTEYNTITGSSATKVVVDSGEGQYFQRGQALLIKDATLTGGYQVRNVSSVSTDDLNLAQTVSGGAAIGTNLGKAILFKPADTGHVPFSLWNYRANGGAIELLGGCRPTQLSMTAAAGQAVSGQFTIEGMEYYYDPMIVTANNKYLDFDEGSTELNAVVTTGTYKDPYELAAAIELAMDAVATADITVTYSDSTRKFTIATGGATLNLKWKTGTHGSDNTDTHIGTLIGFVDTANDTSATTYTSDTALTISASYTPDFDAEDINVAKNNQVLFGSSTDISCFSASNITFNFTNTHTKVPSICATSGRSGSLFTQRNVTVELQAWLESGQAEEFKKYRANDNVIFTYNMGKKSGGNWVAGSILNFHVPSATITNFELADSDGLVQLNMTLQAYVSDGLGEVYVNCL